MQKLDLVTIRDGRKEDEAFIYSTFLRGLYYGNSCFKQISKPIFMANYHAVLEHILSLPAAKVKVACLIDDPDIILAYAILGGNDTILHFVFCKSAWRKAGLAKSLVPETVKTVTHLTSVGGSLLKKHSEVQYNPFDIR